MLIDEEAGDRHNIVTKQAHSYKTIVSEQLKMARSHQCPVCFEFLEPLWDENDNLTLDCNICNNTYVEADFEELVV